jgi:hypothetical protein
MLPNWIEYAARIFGKIQKFLLRDLANSRQA